MAREVTATWSERFTTRIDVGGHALVADVLAERGGDDRGPSPGELLLAAVGA